MAISMNAIADDVILSSPERIDGILIIGRLKILVEEWREAGFSKEIIRSCIKTPAIRNLSGENSNDQFTNIN